MPLYFVLLFIIIPLLELALLIQVGLWVGFWSTVGLVFSTGVIGFAVFRHEFEKVKQQWFASAQAGNFPFQETLEAVLLLLGAAFLITPGVLTDGAGFLLVLPITRPLIRKMVVHFGKERLQNNIVSGNFTHFVYRSGGPPSDMGVDHNSQDADFEVKE